MKLSCPGKVRRTKVQIYFAKANTDCWKCLRKQSESRKVHLRRLATYKEQNETIIQYLLFQMRVSRISNEEQMGV